MSANETVHTSATGGQKAGNDERYDLIPAEPLRRLAIHAGTTVYGPRGGGFHQMMNHAWSFWAGEEVDFATDWVHLIAAAWEAFRIVDPTRPPAFVLDDRRPGSARYDRIPAEALRQLALHFGVGAKKYDDDNWTRGYDWRLTFAAGCRHAEQWRAGETHDPETGSHHLIAFAWHMLVLDEFTRINRGGDTRYCTKVRAWLAAENLWHSTDHLLPQIEDALAVTARRWLPGDDELDESNVNEAAAEMRAAAEAGEPLADWEYELLAASGEPAKPRSQRVVDFRLGYAHRAAQWTDRQGDRWRYHMPGTGMGRWEYFYKPSGTWAEANPGTEYAPYTEVTAPRVVDSLGDTESDTEWDSPFGWYRYETEHSRWTRRPVGYPDWHPTLCTGAGFGPYTEHTTTGDDE